jgi:hypothetical protein
MNLFHAAERICLLAIQYRSSEVEKAVQTLIDGSSERKMYEQSDDRVMHSRRNLSSHGHWFNLAHFSNSR